MSAAAPIIEEAALVIHEEIGRGSAGVAKRATLNGFIPVCAKVRGGPSVLGARGFPSGTELCSVYILGLGVWRGRGGARGGSSRVCL